MSPIIVGRWTTYTRPLGGAVGHQVHRRRIGQVGLEGVDGLVHQPRGRPETARAWPSLRASANPPAQSPCGFCLRLWPSPPGLAVLVALKGFGNAANGALLVVALHNARRNRQAGQRLARGAALVPSAPARPACESPAPGAAGWWCRPTSSAHNRWCRRSRAVAVLFPGSRHTGGPAAGLWALRRVRWLPPGPGVAAHST